MLPYMSYIMRLAIVTSVRSSIAIIIVTLIDFLGPDLPVSRYIKRLRPALQHVAHAWPMPLESATSNSEWYDILCHGYHYALLRAFVYSIVSPRLYRM